MDGKELVPLRRWSEKDLVAAAQQSSRNVIEHLALDYPPIQGMVMSLARSIDPLGVAREELGGAATLGILEALRGFDPERGVRFTTYAFHFIRGEMIKAAYSQSLRREWNAGRRKSVKLVPLPSPSAEDTTGQAFEAEMLAGDKGFGTDQGYAEVDKKAAEAAVHSFVDALPANQREVVRDVFWGEQSHAEAAQRRGVSRPAISRTLQRALRRGRRDLASQRECLVA
jgi:RNA polymerase sigma factor (sigma-70 family)